MPAQSARPPARLLGPRLDSGAWAALARAAVVLAAIVLATAPGASVQSPMCQWTFDGTVSPTAATSGCPDMALQTGSVSYVTGKVGASAV